MEKLGLKYKINILCYPSKLGSDIKTNFRVTVGNVEEYGPAPLAICLVVLETLGMVVE